ncbi:ABC transporter ATP-binding protein [Ferroacidibacillus organovorans]|uniref:Carnitine transport ATP-binding protein OpuCA n=1 Tax=Ferroacidibacillus organovorans TaxID=1765683 RepID=A0A162TCH9_9BACL|nr:ABC transporter ATP-binding protein [Ferroacidibacillus organovorans]KYP80667.1 hypothetical protein AYJ22_10530 [Ferroacidibacillus organovorans]OAG93511.1 hypothetical protein AYW79_10325 [Ferroacidibacillus organovorans]OPG17234.1 hypothetical protein B2M26_02570 [Ferroacidibacillus organovorans]
MLRIESLQKKFGAVQAVTDVSMHVDEGEFVTLLGPSGSGKTTVLRMVAGLEQPTSGTILMDDADVTRMPAQKRNIGMVFQSYALFPNLSVFENIAFPLRVRKWKADAIKARVEELLELVRLTHRRNYAPDQLSGGERQRVALARALSFYPPLLLLDEPLSALDAKVRQSLRSFLKEIQRTTGVTTLMVTHDQEEALELSDRIVVMSQGRVEQAGAPIDVYYRPQGEFTATFIGAINTLQVSVLAVGERAAHGQHVLLSWNGHVFSWLLSDQEVAHQESLTLRVRPESLMVDEAFEEGAARAEVLSVAFMGAVTRMSVRVGQDVVLIDALSSRVPSVVTGQSVGVRFVDQRIEKQVAGRLLAL